MTDFPNWFQPVAQPHFENFLLPRAGDELNCLQIGAYTGDASLWIMENLPFANLDDVDTWQGSDEEAHKAMDFSEVEQVYNAKLSEYLLTGRLVKNKMMSDKFFLDWLNIDFNPHYDFIYIDGDHTAPVVLDDALSAHKLLKVGGILAFDDYLWTDGGESWTTPQPAIDSFVNVYSHMYTPLFAGYQVWLRRDK